MENATSRVFREAEISERLGTILENIHIPDEVLVHIQEVLRRERAGMCKATAQQKQKPEQRLADVRRRMDGAYADKLDGKIPEDFWERKMGEWRADEQQIQFAINGLEEHSESDRLLDVQRILELANRLVFYMVRRNQQNRLNC